MPYHTLDEWQKLLINELPAPKSPTLPVLGAACLRLSQMLCDFEELQYPKAHQWDDPVLQVFKDWVQQWQMSFSPVWVVQLDALQDGDHYQRIGDLAGRLSEKLAIPKLHPGYCPFVDFTVAATAKFQVVQRLTTWQTPDAHRGWLQKYAWGWESQALYLGVASAWPLFLHYQQWGVAPNLRFAEARVLLDNPRKWQGLAAEPSFLTWCYIQRIVEAPVTPDAWRDWVSTLPPEHAAHTLDVPRACQAYELWATLQTPRQPPNWLSLVQMLAPAVVPTEIGPVADLIL